jgi:hypothetical protein
VAGFEPAVSCIRGKWINQAFPHPDIKRSGRSAFRDHYVELPEPNTFAAGQSLYQPNCQILEPEKVLSRGDWIRTSETSRSQSERSDQTELHPEIIHFFERKHPAEAFALAGWILVFHSGSGFHPNQLVRVSYVMAGLLPGWAASVRGVAGRTVAFALCCCPPHPRCQSPNLIMHLVRVLSERTESQRLSLRRGN